MVVVVRVFGFYGYKVVVIIDFIGFLFWAFLLFSFFGIRELVSSLGVTLLIRVCISD